MARNKDPSSIRSNFWCGILYPDSAPNDWLVRIDRLHIKAVVSPLHSPDPDPDTGYEKKQHYHIMFLYDSLKSFSQAQEDFLSIGAINYIVVPKSRPAMLKYFCHLDNPSKEKLNPSDVRTFGGVDYLEQIADAGNDFLALLDMTHYIHTHDIKSFMSFMLFCECNNLEWARIASTRSTLYIKAVIESQRNWQRDHMEDGI